MTHKGEDISGQVGTGMGTVWRGQALTLSLTGGKGGAESALLSQK